MESIPLVLSVLLMGLVPVPHTPTQAALGASVLPLSSPAPTVRDFPGDRLAKTLTASGVAVVDLQSGQQLYARGGQQRRAVGSLTKLMTAIIIAEEHAMDEIVTIPKDVANVEGTKAKFPPGAQFSVGDLLSALLIASANDAADTLAKFHAGTTDEFARMMNDRATALGLTQTSFTNPSGLDHPRQFSTAQDMAWLGTYALRNEEIRKRLGMPSATIVGKGGQKIVLTHTHSLVRIGSEVIAGKTGTTTAAKQCIISVVREAGREYLVVILGSRERYVDLRAVLRAIGNFLA